MWVSWIDDMLCIGNPKDLIKAKQEFMKKFLCDDIGEFKEYVGCKMERNDKTMKSTQPVLLQSYRDEFELPTKEYESPAIAG